jgi:predicted nucleic acid-binding Zn ribbon protein
MARRDDYTGVSMHCVVCQNPIPGDRKKDSVTCGPLCTKARKNYFRSRIDAISCRYCQRPASPEERALFLRWRREMKKAEAEKPPASEQA